MVRTRVVLAGVAALAWAGGAGAQTSLFDKPAANAPPAAAEAPAAPAAAAKPKPKPKGPTPARALSIINASGSALTELEVSGGGKSAKLAKQLGSQEKATLRLPPMTTCVVTITATFERAGEAETMEQDICKDRSVRLTD